MAEINLKKLTAGGPSDIEVFFNGNSEGDANALIPLNVNLTNGTSDITPTSVVLTGNDLDIVVEPNGVLFQQITPSQYTSYLSGDEGWRVQNGIFAYTPPTNPKVYAELDYTSPNFWNVLKSPLVVGGVSSTTRFTDVNGLQVFSATGNADQVVIDKLTGRMWLRNRIANNQWATFVFNATIYSIVVNGITYSDWYLPTQNEFISLYQDYATTAINVDSLTGANILSTSFSSQTATTSPTTTQSKCYINTSRTFINLTKGGFDYGATYITDAKHLITAP